MRTEILPHHIPMALVPLPDPRDPLVADRLPDPEPESDASLARAKAAHAQEQIAADHARLQTRSATEALRILVERASESVVRDLLDFVDVCGGTTAVRRRLDLVHGGPRADR